MSALSSLLFATLLISCIAMSVGSGGMVGGWSPMAPDGESVERNSNFAAQQINMRSNSLHHKKLVNVHSAEAQVVAGVKYRLVFDIAATTCTKNSNVDPATCNEYHKEMPIERCTAVVWERSWLNERELLEFSCERYMSHEEYFSEENQAKEKAFKENATATANAL